MPYQLLASRGPYDPKIVQGFEDSRLVHTSVEKIGVAPPSTATEGQTEGAASEPASAPATGANTPVPANNKGGDDDDEGEGELPDSNERSIANTRDATDKDGILMLAEIEKGMAEVLPQPARSAYASTKWDGETYAERGGFETLENPSDAQGGGEPAYTCFTPLFRLTLGEFCLMSHVRPFVCGLCPLHPRSLLWDLIHRPPPVTHRIPCHLW